VHPRDAAAFSKEVRRNQLIIGSLQCSKAGVMHALRESNAHAVVKPNHDKGETFQEIAEVLGVIPYDYVRLLPGQLQHYQQPDVCGGVWLKLHRPTQSSTPNAAETRSQALRDFCIQHTCIVQHHESTDVGGIAADALLLRPYSVGFAPHHDTTWLAPLGSLVGRLRPQKMSK